MLRKASFAAALITSLSVGLLLATAIASRQAQRLDGMVNRQAILIRNEPVTTESTSFEEIPGLSDEIIKNRGSYTITFSGEFSGGPIEIRMRGAQPGPILFGDVAAAGGEQHTSYSFVFGDRAAAEGACSTIRAEWRSVDGGPVTLEEGSIVVSYRFVGDKRAREIGCV